MGEKIKTKCDGKYVKRVWVWNDIGKLEMVIKDLFWFLSILQLTICPFGNVLVVSEISDVTKRTLYLGSF